MSVAALRPLRVNSKYIVLIQILISFIFAIIVLYPNISAKWNLTDDHEIIDFLGKDHNLSFQEIPGMLIKTEAGFQIKQARYRPVYYLVKLIETAVWGNNPLPWYAFRIALFGASIFIAWLLLGRFLGIIAGGLVCLLFLSHSFWQSLLLGLGPAEHYCMIGLALYCLAFVKLWEQQTNHTNNTWWGILAFGAILCMGSKENFLILLPITAILVYRAWKYKQHNIISIIINLLIFIFGLFITIAVILLLKKNGGVDIYCNPTGSMSRFKILLSGFFSISHWEIQLPFWLSLIIVFSAILFHKFKRNKISEVTLAQSKRLFFAETACILFWYSQFAFYNGIWPIGLRSDFPGVLAQDLAYVFLFFYPLTILRNISSENLNLRRLSKVMHAVVIILLSIFLIKYGFNNYKELYKSAIAHRNSSQMIEKVFLKTMKQAKENPNDPIIFICTKVYSYEGILFLGKRLVAYNINNPFVIIFNGLDISSCNNGAELKLFKGLEKLSNGEELPKDAYFSSNFSLTPRFYNVKSLPQPIEPCMVIHF